MGSSPASDTMEAKNKDLALFNLMEELKKVPYISFINQASIEFSLQYVRGLSPDIFIHGIPSAICL